VSLSVQDATPPVLQLPSDITVTNDVGNCGAVVAFQATATDNIDGSVPVTYSQDPGTEFPVGTTTVDVSAMDSSGNVSTESFAITVVDNEPPVLVVQDTTYDLDADGFKSADDVLSSGAIVTRTDNCGITRKPSKTGPMSFFCTYVQLGISLPITVTEIDIHGNSAKATFTASVTDSLGACPEITSPNKGIVQVVENHLSVTTITAIDNVDSGSSPGVLFFDLGGTDGYLFNVDPVSGVLTFAAPPDFENPLDQDGDNVYEVEVYAFDSDHNEDTLILSVQVVADETPPALEVPADITEYNDAGVCGAIVTFTVTATDAIDGNVAVDLSHASGSFFPVGTTQVTATAVDSDGNVSSGSFTVTVVDNEPPAVVTQDVTHPFGRDGAAYLDDFFSNGIVSSTDNCGLGTTKIQGTVTKFICRLYLGVSRYIYFKQYDVNGNYVWVSFAATFEDPLGACPYFTAPSDLRITVKHGQQYVTTVAATDEVDSASTPGVLSYYLVESSELDSSLFEFDSSTQELLFKSPPNYWNPLDLNGDNLYEVSLEVTDSDGNVRDLYFEIRVERN
jgi:hypothetical protein